MLLVEKWTSFIVEDKHGILDTVSHINQVEPLWPKVFIFWGPHASGKSEETGVTFKPYLNFLEA